MTLLNCKVGVCEETVWFRGCWTGQRYFCWEVQLPVICWNACPQFKAFVPLFSLVSNLVHKEGLRGAHQNK